MDDILVSLW